MSEVQVNTLTSYSGAGLDIRENVLIDDSGHSSGNLTVEGATTLAGTLTCTGAATVGTTLGVTGASSLAGVTASGTIAANSDLSVANGLTVSSGGATITGNGSFSGTLGVTGNTTVAALSCTSLSVGGSPIGTSAIVGAWYGTVDIQCVDDGAGGTTWSFTGVTQTRSFGGLSGALAGSVINVTGVDQANTNYIPIVNGPNVTISNMNATNFTLTAAGLVAANTTNDAETYTETVHMSLLILDL